MSQQNINPDIKRVQDTLSRVLLENYQTFLSGQDDEAVQKLIAVIKNSEVNVLDCADSTYKKFISNLIGKIDCIRDIRINTANDQTQEIELTLLIRTVDFFFTFEVILDTQGASVTSDLYECQIAFLDEYGAAIDIQTLQSSDFDSALANIQKLSLFGRIKHSC